MLEIGIVVVGYKNLAGITRLLKSLNDAIYNKKVKLFISIDYSGNRDVLDAALDFNWLGGEKTIIEHKTNLGLKKHIMSCGNIMNEYSLDAVCVLEDDIIVSPYFFDYVEKTANLYYEIDKIEGVSLYSYKYNINAKRVFNPLPSRYDVYFLQYPQSWGQVWFRKKWNAFVNWYSDEKLKENSDFLPQNILKWGEKSWLKHHVAYCILNERYFVYPYLSLSTNFSDIGTHNKNQSVIMQVPIQTFYKEYELPEFNESSLKYDGFFENIGIKKSLEFDTNLPDVDIDLYGKKEKYKSRYVLTSSKLHFKIIKSYGLILKPMEQNVIKNIDGNYFYLYDTTINQKNKFSDNTSIEIEYDIGIISKEIKMIKYFISKIFRKVFKQRG